MSRLRISYNAPVVLTFALLAVVVQLLPDETQANWFASHGKLVHTGSYVGLVSHILGHANWNHLLANFMLILLLGPILEERYGSLSLLVMIAITALFSGIVDLIMGSGTHGASGIAFMMILLASTANIRQGTIPLTFVAVAVIYIGGELVKAFDDDNISQLGHILGGLCGAAFGFLGAKAKGTDTTIPQSALGKALPTSTKKPGF